MSKRDATHALHECNGLNCCYSTDLDKALRKQIDRYKSYRMFSDDLKGNALLTVLDLLKRWKDAYPNERYTNEDLSEILLAAIAREMQTKELGFLD